MGSQAVSQQRTRIILPNDRVAVSGRTGSGKSMLVQRYLAGYRNVIALDTKGDSDDLPRQPPGKQRFWPSLYQTLGEDLPRFTRLIDLAKFGKGHAIYRPDPHEMTWEYYEAFFRWIYDRRNTIVWIDEVYSVTDGQEIPFWYKALLTRGRSRGIGVWSCTQRPKFVPNFIFSESEHHFVFRLILEEDRAKVAAWAGKEVMTSPPGKHGFWYYNIQSDGPTLVPDGIDLNR